jgi:hypothetical protein
MNAPTPRSRAGRILAAALTALLGLAANAEAQTSTRDSNNGSAVAAAPANISRAIALEAEANARLVQLNGPARTASLFERAARLRPENDPERVADLRMAGLMYRHAGRHAAARLLLEAAAEGALRYGDVVSAAHMFVDAAWAARMQGDAEAVRRLAGKANCLAHSPLITVADAAGIRHRISVSSDPVVVVR